MQKTALSSVVASSCEVKGDGLLTTFGESSTQFDTPNRSSKTRPLPANSPLYAGGVCDALICNWKSRSASGTDDHSNV